MMSLFSEGEKGTVIDGKRGRLVQKGIKGWYSSDLCMKGEVSEVTSVIV